MEKIKKKKDFDFIFKNGKSYKDTFLVLKYIKNNSKKNRAAFVVSSKVSKSAVKRNKIRRRLNEIMRKIDEKTGYDFIFIALSGMEKVDFDQTKHMVKNLLSRTR